MNHRTYLNPKLLSLTGAAIHVNPNFQQNANVYVNPLFFQPKPTSSQACVAAPPKVGKKSSKYTWRRGQEGAKSSPKPTEKIITKGGRKLIRKPVLVSPINLKKREIISKYKLDKRPSFIRRRSGLLRNLKFQRHRHFSKENIYRVNKQTGNQRGPKPDNEKRSVNKKLINIGGILYRATSNKLTKAANHISLKNGCKPSDKLVINVRGESFLLSGNGSTLKRLQKNGSHPRRRVDFGGVTYKQTTGDTFERTNAHQVRSVLNQARQRSLAILAARHRKINTPCGVYQKLGRCGRQLNGICAYTHDRKNVDLCKRFLRGNCTDKTCLLSHEVVHQKMPTCKFFLDGSCGRENCPYLHVKVSDRADICLPFLQGYCPSGDQCSQRHEKICPAFDKNGVCKKGNQCPYPHKKPRTKTKRKIKVEEKVKKKMKKEDGGEGKRYYAAESESLGKQVVVPERKRLSTLPSFIALNST